MVGACSSPSSTRPSLPPSTRPSHSPRPDPLFPSTRPSLPPPRPSPLSPSTLSLLSSLSFHLSSNSSSLLPHPSCSSSSHISLFSGGRHGFYQLKLLWPAWVWEQYAGVKFPCESQGSVQRKEDCSRRQSHDRNHRWVLISLIYLQLARYCGYETRVITTCGTKSQTVPFVLIVKRE